MAGPLDMLFQAADALPPPVPGENQVEIQCVALLLAPSTELVNAQGPLQFTRSKGTAFVEPAFFSGFGFAGPDSDPNAFKLE
jgi:hypothetical protein